MVVVGGRGRRFGAGSTSWKPLRLHQVRSLSVGKAHRCLKKLVSLVQRIPGRTRAGNGGIAQLVPNLPHFRGGAMRPSTPTPRQADSHTSSAVVLQSTLSSSSSASPLAPGSPTSFDQGGLEQCVALSYGLGPRRCGSAGAWRCPDPEVRLGLFSPAHILSFQLFRLLGYASQTHRDPVDTSICHDKWMMC